MVHLLVHQVRLEAATGEWTGSLSSLQGTIRQREWEMLRMGKGAGGSNFSKVRWGCWDGSGTGKDTA